MASGEPPPLTEPVDGEVNVPPPPASVAVDVEGSNVEASTELEPVPLDLPSSSVEPEVENAAVATTSSNTNMPEVERVSAESEVNPLSSNDPVEADGANGDMEEEVCKAPLSAATNEANILSAPIDVAMLDSGAEAPLPDLGAAPPPEVTPDPAAAPPPTVTSEPQATPPPEVTSKQIRLQTLRGALAAKLGRVIDIFREWDDDGDGVISRAEFRKALPVLGVAVDRADCNALFDLLDDDSSGFIDYKELNAKLRSGATVQTNDEKSGKPRSRKKGGGFKIASERRPQREGGPGSVVKVLELRDSDNPVEALRKAMGKHMTRVIDVFRQWDEDGSGSISKKEFRRALPILGMLDCPKAVSELLFDRLDEDKSGSIDYQELNHSLRQRSDIPAYGDVYVNKGIPKIPTSPRTPKSSGSGVPVLRSRPVRAPRKVEEQVDPQQYIDNLVTMEEVFKKAQRGERLTSVESSKAEALGMADLLAKTSSSPTAAALARQRGMQPQLALARTCELAAKSRLLVLQRELHDERTERAFKAREEERQAAAKEVRDLSQPTHAQRVSFPRTEAASRNEINNVSTILNTRLMETFSDPRGAWYKLFRHVDKSESGSISFGQFQTIIRKLLGLSFSDLPVESIKAVWVALDIHLDSTGDKSGLITCADFAHFMRLGESAFKQRATPRERVEAKAREAASVVRAEKRARLHRNIRDELANEPPAPKSAIIDLSRRFNEHLEGLRRADREDYEAHSAAIKLFRLMNTNGTGLATFNEFSTIIREELQVSQELLSTFDLKRLWLALDENGSGHIDVGEFGRFMRLGAPQRREWRKEQLDSERRELASNMRQQEHALRMKRDARSQEDAQKRRERYLAAKHGPERDGHRKPHAARSMTAPSPEPGQMLEPHPPTTMAAQLHAFADVQPAPAVAQLEISIMMNARFSQLQEKLACHSWYALFRLIDCDDAGSISFDSFKKLTRQQLGLPPPTLSDSQLRSLWVSLDSAHAGSITWRDFSRFSRLGEQAPQGAAQRLTRKLEHGHALTQEEKQELNAASDAALPCLSKGAEAQAQHLARKKEAASHLRAEKDARIHRHIREEVSDVPAADKASLVDLSCRFNDRMLKLSNESDTPVTWHKLMLQMDTDDSGLISYAELRSMVRDVLMLSTRVLDDKTLKSVFIALDGDASGNISIGEFHTFMRMGEPEKQPLQNLEKRKELSYAARASIEELKVRQAKKETVDAAMRAKEMQQDAKAIEAQIASLKAAVREEGGSRCRMRVHKEEEPESQVAIAARRTRVVYAS
jgi:Ca2+-binding EF-hand superfamily protein